MESDAEQAMASVSMRDTRVTTSGARDSSHSPVLVASLRHEATENDMDVCWYLAEIAKVFWYDRHPRLRKGKPSVPQVPPPVPKSDETM